MVCLCRRVFSQLLLVALKSLPRDVARMMVMNHRLPLLGIAQQGAAPARWLLAAFAISTPAKSKGACVSRVVQERQDTAVGGFDPDQFSFMFGGQIQVLLLMVEENLPSTA